MGQTTAVTRGPCLALVVLIGGLAVAGVSGATEPSGLRIDRVAWLEGVWESEDGGSCTEERWGPPAGGSMLATSRTVAEGRTVRLRTPRPGSRMPAS